MANPVQEKENQLPRGGKRRKEAKKVVGEGGEGWSAVVVACRGVAVSKCPLFTGRGRKDETGGGFRETNDVDLYKREGRGGGRLWGKTL